LKSLCDNPVSLTTRPIQYPGDICLMMSKIQCQIKMFSTLNLVGDCPAILTTFGVQAYELSTFDPTLHSSS
jgi:hypothetical protein